MFLLVGCCLLWSRLQSRKTQKSDYRAKLEAQQKEEEGAADDTAETDSVTKKAQFDVSTPVVPTAHYEPPTTSNNINDAGERTTYFDGGEMQVRNPLRSDCSLHLMLNYTVYHSILLQQRHLQ